MDIESKIKLLLEVKELTYNDAIEVIGLIEPEIQQNIESDILKMDLQNIHGIELEVAFDNIICSNIDKWIVENE